MDEREDAKQRDGDGEADEVVSGDQTEAADHSLTPGTLVDGARMYAAAADAVNDAYPNALHVLSHLLGMSIELALKAYLRHAGCTERELKKLGHDLPAIYNRAQEFGLDYTGSRTFVLFVLGWNYDERLFAYPREGVMTVIMPRRLREMAHELIEIAFRKIKGDALLDAMRAEPGLSIRSAYPEDVNASAWAVTTAPRPLMK
jgi:hypothetical protein